MQRYLKLWFLFSVLLMLFTTAFADTYQIGDGTDTQYTVPMYVSYNYSWSRSVYRRSDIVVAGMSNAGIISSIGYDVESLSQSYTLTNQFIYMRHTNDANAGLSVMDPSDGFELVYSGTVTIDSVGWFEIPLDTAFSYNGVNGIDIIWENRHGASQPGLPYFRSISTDTLARHDWDNGTFPHYGRYAGAVKRPNLKVEFQPLSDTPTLHVSPASLNFGTISYSEVSNSQYLQVSNYGSGTLQLTQANFAFTGADADLFSIGDNSVFPISLQLMQSAGIPLVMTGTAEGIASATLEITYGGDTAEVALSGRVLPEGLVYAQVGEGNATQQYIPNFGGNSYSYSRSLYSATELQLAGISGAAMIHSVGYHVSLISGSCSLSNQKMYIRSTTATNLNDNTILTPDEFQLVYSGATNYLISGWHTIEFDTPFLYDGASGIEIIWENRHGDFTANPPTFASTNISNMGLYGFSDASFPAYGSTGYLSHQRPNLLVSFVQFSGDPRLVISTDSIDFGNLNYDDVSDARNVVINNMGGGTIALSANNFDITGANAALFSINESVLPTSLTGGQSVSIGVVATAVVEGDISATLEINYEGETYSVELTAFVHPEGIAIVELGDGTQYQRQPFGALYGYERSVAIYEVFEIGRYGTISKVGWNVATAAGTSLPYKVYMGTTQESSQYHMPSQFSEYISDMTLVAQGSHSFSTVGWHEFELDEPYTFAGGNLVVVVETNYGGSGTNTYPSFYYTPNVGSTHQAWASDSSAPSASSITDGNRANIMLTLTPLSNEPQMTVSPQSHHFGTIPYGLSGDPVQVRILNSGGGTLTITGADLALSGEHATSFYYEDDAFPMSLTTGRHGYINVYVNSTVEGTNLATLTITYGDHSAEIELSARVLPEGTFDIQLGAGLSYNNASSGVTPYQGYYKNFRMHTLVRADEITAAGGVPGYINSISYEVRAVNNYSPRPNYRIGIAHTIDQSLSTGFGNTTFTQVYQSNDFMPNVGWNTHFFDEPFMWDGSSNIIIETITDMAGSSVQNASVYNNNPGGYNCTTTFTSDTQSAATASSGNVNASRPNMKLSMSMTGLPDMAAYGITGARMPNVDTANIYRLTVRNLSPDAIEDYLVMIVNADGDVLASVPGPEINSLEIKTVIVPWTPTALGTTTIYGKVEYDEDTFPNNDIGEGLSVEVIPAGYSITQFGYEGESNEGTSRPTPYGTLRKSFREQYLLTVDELTILGGIPGIIHSISYYVSGLNSCVAMPNYRIRLKHTSQSSLTPVFETGNYTQVYLANYYVPVAGWNEHVFTAPFFWNGVDNLLIDILTDEHVQPGYSDNASVHYTTMSFNSAIYFESDTTPAIQAISGQVGQVRPNVRMKMIRQDFGSLSGMVSENGYPLNNATVRIQDTPLTTMTNAQGYYSLPYAPVGEHTVIAGKQGYESHSAQVSIELNEEIELNFELVGTPEISFSPTQYNFGDVMLGQSASKLFSVSNVGGSELIISSIELQGNSSFSLINLPTLPLTLRNEQGSTFGVKFVPNRAGTLTATVTITDDRGRRYNYGITDARLSNRESSQISLSGTGVGELTIGDGGSIARCPLDFYYRSSVYETVLTNAELNNFIGQITGLKLYNNFYDTVSHTPVEIYMGTTTQPNLQSGWISAGNLELVFNGFVTFPQGSNVISITFNEPFHYYNHQNLVLLFNRPYDNEYYNYSDMFLVQTWGNSRARSASSNSHGLNPFDPSDHNLTGTFPKMTFITMPGGVGSLSGYVLNEEGTPLQNVSVSMGDRVTTTTNSAGFFAFNTILPGDYRLSFSCHGYLDFHEDFSIDEFDELDFEIVMAEREKVSVSGTVVSSDESGGIAGATVYFYGYDNFSVETDDDGNFVMTPGVYTGFRYSYMATALGYEPAAGEIDVGDSVYEMGTITLQELAYGPMHVEAIINPDHSSTTISWEAPDPSAFEIMESFEGDMFPPLGWDQTITNTGLPNAYGVRPTWNRFSTAEGVSPSEGVYQAGLSWIAEHQNEWLYTPSFSCPQNAYLRFDTHIYTGSEGGDHYYVKVSTNEGVRWQVLWDGSTLPQGLNSYNQPITIDLSAYASRQIILAWHADDGNDQMGMWHDWYIDNIYIGNFMGERAITPTLSMGTKAEPSESKELTRGLEGYKVWRLQNGQQDSENNWILLNQEPVSQTEIIDSAWAELALGEYLWAVRAIYTADVISSPIFSNVLTKATTSGTFSGFVRNSQTNQGIAGVIVSAGDDFTGTTTASGFYNITLPAGMYSVTANHDDYNSLTYNDVIITPGDNTTLNFTLVPASNEDVVEIVATALSANYPNPFNPETTISYDIKEPTKVRLDVFNLKGQLVKTIVNENQASGRYNVVFQARDDRDNRLSSGIYFYRLKAGDYTKTRKMMLME